MKNNLSVSEQLMYSTVRIECLLANGQSSTGTGFFFRFLDEGLSNVPCVVTNKHVVQGAIKGKIIFSLSDADGNPINTEHMPVEYNNFENSWIFHPEADIDLCILPIAPILQQIEEEKGRKVFFISLDKSLIPSFEQFNQLSAIEDITMIGYPNGLWDRVNNLPIIRKGITATHPKFNHNGREEFVIDAACYPGSSGSPVMIFNQGTYSSGNDVHVGTRALLLGILFAGPQFTSTGEIVVLNVPTSRPISVSHIPMNLGYVVKSHKLLDFEELLSKLIQRN
jgi:hypothetical protein